MQIDPAITTILREQQMTLTPDDIARLIELIQARQKVQAVGLIHQKTRAGLKASKNVADVIEQTIWAK